MKIRESITLVVSFVVVGAISALASIARRVAEMGDDDAGEVVIAAPAHMAVNDEGFNFLLWHPGAVLVGDGVLHVTNGDRVTIVERLSDLAEARDG